MQETIPEYTVSEISFAIKRTMEDAFARVRVRGEIFGCKRADSGHYYLSLKDENANLSAVCWKGVAAGLKVKPEDGLEVVAAGRITTFAGKSSYQLVIEQMEVAGAGALLKLLEERKQKFAAEGLFDPAHKKPIPFLPRVIGVVTSPAGAVIRDIIHRVTDRFPVRIIVWPTLVQGEGAAEQIAAAVNGFNRLPADGPVPRPDLHVEVTPVPAAELSATAPGEPSAAVRERVVRAREVQAARFAGTEGVHTNAMMNAAMLREYCRPDAASAVLLERAMERLSLSARAYDRILKVARTIADLAGRETIAAADVAEAIIYRSLDRGNWGR